MSSEPDFVAGGLGLTVTEFFDLIADQEARKLLDPNLLSVLDSMSGGRIEGSDLRRVAKTVVDFNVVLGETTSRNLVLSQIPRSKFLELEDRLEGKIDQVNSVGWSDWELGQLREFFGLVNENANLSEPPPATFVAPSYGLFDFQRHVVSRLTQQLSEGDQRTVLHMPTGTGKTRTAMHVVAHNLRMFEPSIVVWLASGKELLEQAIGSFQEAWNHLGSRTVQIGSMWGNRTPDLNSFADGFLAVGLAKAWAWSTSTDPNWALKLSPRVRLVVFDEAHQSIAETYRQISEELTTHYMCALLGLTATPGRTWADIDADGELADFFGGNKVSLEVPGDNPIDFLVQSGFLARANFRTLLSEPGIKFSEQELSQIARGLDIPTSVLEAVSISNQYVAAVTNAVEELLDSGHTRVIVFAATVEHARTLGAVLVMRNIRGYVVTGVTTKRLREQYIRAFKSHDEIPSVLINFGVLTTGFDAPRASAAVIARPTRSLVLFSQMVGRAIRGPKAGGTEECEIVTVVDPRLPGFGDIARAFLNWEDVWM